MALSQLGSGRYQATLDPDWTIGPKVHGGTMLALCAAAAQAELDGAPATSDPAGPNPAGPTGQPVAVSAGFLSAPDPGPVELIATVRKRGRRISLVDVELEQGGRTAVRAAVTLGAPDVGPPLHADGGAELHRLPARPPASAVEVAGHPMARIMHLAQVCDVRFDPASTAFLDGGPGAPEVRLWVRPKQEATSALFALMAGDISAPVTLNLGRFGWAPTVQLTAYLRGLPVDGWLRVSATSTLVGGVWFEEDHLVLDETGAVVVQSRQLALVPADPGERRSEPDVAG
ncbi:thioesterase family protein [Corynebacteriales bacterium D3-21]|uniref:Thioesterase family protein n=2 Tax=Speluncibacter jeojiensis TaxID=2710754 RepID=A0A9X4M3H9_9ACTN|nr:thioesterase family protein [Rhodococcus sp. D2-41]MDG3016360.1 thioesterase family protein [Corynebacteriales bacterium D3-21]